ncbi:RNA-binding protein vip1 [Gigaspora margarita]|uniref:RNA-binding protein vip1 n=1 Tax=Gigaspora margarita TaxID=4874 RepID=A0A8H3XKY0_GIGMA|nr:RNA-binding protein vip1 [Gigaspora margarita]
MSRRVIVHNISGTASEKTVKDFFLFCGKIKEFELVKDESSDKQIAHITFERDTAAKTALMLTNAVIGDSQITVKCDDDDAPHEEYTQDGDGISQEDKPKSAIFAEILAAGYQLQDTIIQTGIDYDAKFGISARLTQYLQALQDQIKSLNENYHVTETISNKSREIDNKFGVQDKVKYATSTVQESANKALETAPAKQILSYYSSASKQVADVHNEALRIANEKKASQIVEASNQANQEKKVDTQ